MVPSPGNVSRALPPCHFTLSVQQHIIEITSNYVLGCDGPREHLFRKELTGAMPVK
jgi:hypothetical protein